MGDRKVSRFIGVDGVEELAWGRCLSVLSSPVNGVWYDSHSQWWGRRLY
jgi:hypothetical protein